MDEFIGSVKYNQNGEILVSSSYLTYQYWTGFVSVLTKLENRSANEKKLPLMLSPLTSTKNITSGVCDAKWTSNTHFLIGTETGEISHFKIDLNSNEKFHQVMNKHEHDNLITCLATKIGSDVAFSASDDSNIKIWDLNEQISIKTYKAHNGSVSALSVNPNDDNNFLSGSQDKRFLLWDTRKEKPAYLINNELTGYVSALAWSHVDINQIVIGSQTGELVLFDIRSLKPLNSSKVHKRLIRRVSYNNRANIIATASEDCETLALKITNESDNNGQVKLSQIYSYKHRDYVTDLDWNPKDLNEYITCSWDGFVESHKLPESA